MNDDWPPSPGERQRLVSVVIPVYCEGGHLRAILTAVDNAMEPTGCSYEILLIDDGSPDETWRVICAESQSFPMLRAFRLSRNFGKEAALCAGMAEARGDAVIVMDGDLQHPPALLPEMIRIWCSGAVDIVEGVKVDRGRESPVSRASAWLFYAVTSRLSGFQMRGACDFKLLDRKVVDAWLQMEERNVFFRGTVAWLGFTRAQIPFVVAERAGGRSGWSYVRRLHLAITGITSFSSLPLQLVTAAGTLFLVFAVILATQTLFVLLSGRAVSGFATVILLLLIVGSLLMISLGLIGSYLARIYDEVKRRPRYVVTQRIDRATADGGSSPSVVSTPRG